MSEVIWIVAAAVAVLVWWIGYGQGSWRGRRNGYREGAADGRAYERERLTRPELDMDHIADLAGWHTLDARFAAADQAEFDVWCQYCGKKAGREFTNVHSRKIQGTYHPGCLALLEAEMRETGNL